MASEYLNSKKKNVPSQKQKTFSDMKHLLSFVAGLVVGALITYAIPYFINETEEEVGYRNSITLFEEVGECISTNNFKIFNVSDGGALALELVNTGIEQLDIPTGLVVFFRDETGTSYFDGKVIKMPKGKCAKQIGLYRYLTVDETEKVVPIVQITKR